MTFNSIGDILIMFSLSCAGYSRMEKNDLADLTIIMLGLLMDMFRRDIISYEQFIKNTRIKVNFLKNLIKNPTTEDMTEKIKHILSQYHICLSIGYNSVCNIPLSEDRFPY